LILVGILLSQVGVRFQISRKVAAQVEQVWDLKGSESRDAINRLSTRVRSYFRFEQKVPDEIAAF
jgi:hypothetical protein